MRRISRVYLFCVFVLLIIMRFCVSSAPWIASITILGLFVTWYDMMAQVWVAEKKKNLTTNGKIRYSVVFLLLSGIGLGMILLLVWNLVEPIGWLNKQIVLDEITLVALTFCVLQKEMVTIISKIIEKE